MIDLRELFTVLKRRQKLIWSVTTFLTILAIVYTFFIAKSVYSGNVMLEIGEVVNNNIVIVNNKLKNTSDPNTIFYLDNIYNLENIMSIATDTIIDIPKKTTNILRISYENNDKELIKKKLEFAVNFVIDRHKEKAELYKSNNAKIKMTQLVGKITVNDAAIKPKKKLYIIVAFITGLMLSIFLAFFLEFTQGLRKSESDKNN